ncbi:MAG: efflux RND transporter periplasmic adaptor subunit [Saprospiraceae bacterium]|nr:efflux RND transporter periplasmic adaptor subunit [Saprospiraceae bacterium]
MKIQFNVLMILVLSLLACNDQKEEHLEVASQNLQSASYVKVVPVRSESTHTDFTNLGVVINKTEAKPSFKTGGVVANTNFREGDRVTAGQILATLMLDEIDAQVQQAKEAVNKAERDLERANNLHADSVATLEQVQNAGTALSVAQKNFEIAQFNRQYSEVRAPISGKIVKQLLREGEVAGPGMPVAVILGVNRADWRIKVGLIPSDWSQLKIGDEAVIRMEAYPGEQFKAVISDKAVMTTDASGTLDIELTFKEYPKELAAGMICKMVIPRGAGNKQILIPIDALVNTDGQRATIFTIRDGRALSVPITINRILGDQVAVGEGLEGVDSVVTIGAIYLEEGDLISAASN